MFFFIAFLTPNTNNDILLDEVEEKVGDNINIDKMINMLLIKLSKTHNIFYMEKRSYKEDKIYKSYIAKIDGTSKEFKNKKDLLIYLSKEMI